ncbi:glycerol-3-phosphate dehydrogenase [Pseudovibrio japonicus]|uniref:Glycerol-3-phosphate dehydrogenase n=1 Tax=Pseudovibrio japonicus TaxID=366534 RepID=A0ABQ3EQH3_9HYPH|nr:FAD-binding oxidoreductase [Pseudovibrio japonicus]GHB42162.1 glycerol-3-phosphate dehydrogenase [Pseudovibrio japonicus]
MTQHFDFLIIGGGIAGISGASQLAEHGKTAVLEMEDVIGHHSTGRSAAVFIGNYGNAVIRALNAVSEPTLMNPEGICDSSVLSHRGVLMLLDEAGHENLLETYEEGAVGLEKRSVEEALKMVPILDPSKIASALYEPNAFDIDVDRLFQGYARLLKSRGGEIILSAPAMEIEHTDDQWTVTTPKGKFSAPILINAAGAWADKIAELAGIRPVGLVPKRRTLAIVPLPEGVDCSSWPVFESSGESYYAKPEAGKLLVSPADEVPVEPHDAFVDDMVLAEGLHHFEHAVNFSITRVEHSWAGLRSFVEDRSPVVGFAPDAEGFFWLAGQGGYGIQTSPALSRLTADLCLGRPTELPEETLAALSPNRFT